MIIPVFSANEYLSVVPQLQNMHFENVKGIQRMQKIEKQTFTSLSFPSNNG